jgi:hypothetical protein
MWYEMCRINRLSLGCAHALDPVVLVESESRASMGSVLFSLSLYGPIQSSVSHSRKDENSEIVY